MGGLDQVRTVDGPPGDRGQAAMSLAVPQMVPAIKQEQGKLNQRKSMMEFRVMQQPMEMKLNLAQLSVLVR